MTNKAMKCGTCINYSVNKWCKRHDSVISENAWCKDWSDKINRFDIHLKVIEHWGEELQTNKAIEEMNELIFELKKVNKDKNNIISEMADVLNTLEQQCFIHSISPNDIQAEQDRKMQRTLERISK